MSPDENNTAPSHPETAAAEDPARFYRDIILRHSTAPVGYRAAIAATHSAEQYNPFCGDRIVMNFEIRDGQVRQAAFDGEACAMCLASASLLCEGAPGHTIGELRDRQQWLEQALTAPVIAAVPGTAGTTGTNATGAATPPGVEALVPLLGVKRFPSRVKCVLLPWIAAADALNVADEKDTPGEPPAGGTTLIPPSGRDSR